MPEDIRIHINKHKLMFYVKMYPAGATTKRTHFVFVFCVRMTQYATRLPDTRERGKRGHSRKESMIILMVSGMAPQRLRPTIIIICPCPKGQEQIIITARSAVMRARGLCRPR